MRVPHRFLNWKSVKLQQGEGVIYDAGHSTNNTASSNRPVPIVEYDTGKNVIAV